MKNEREWELQSRFLEDRMEAICPHGIGHHKGIHGCDGCCANAPAALWEKVSEDT